MKEKLLELLACPTCGGDILLAYASKYDGKEIIDAVLTCKKCDREYKVVRGVPRFVDLSKIEDDKAATAAATNIFDVSGLAALKRQAKSGDPAANKVVARQLRQGPAYQTRCRVGSD